MAKFVIDEAVVGKNQELALANLKHHICFKKNILLNGIAEETLCIQTNHVMICSR